MELTLLIVVPFIVFLASGVPIAFCLACISLVLLVKEGLSPLLVVQRMLASTDSFPLLAIPFFLLAGNLMNIGGVTDRLFRFANCLVGHIRGGLAHVNVLCSMIFAGMSGAAVADAAGIGMVETKAMMDRGYDKDFSVAVTAASAIIGPIIPPSIIMIIYGVTAEVSIGRLFLGGFLPGIFMGVSQMILCYFISVRRGYPREKRATLAELWQSFRRALLPLIAPVIIIGGILTGLFTATEAGCVAAIYAFALGVFVYREIRTNDLMRIVVDSMLTTASIVFIIASAGAFAYLLTFYRVPHLTAEFLSGLTRNPLIMVLLINVALVVLGCFLDAASIIIMAVPVLLPTLKALNIDLTYFGIVITVNMCLAMLTPPVGVVMYVMCQVMDMSVERYTKAIWPFLALITAVIAVMIFFPRILLFIPDLFLPEGGPAVR
jgi:C4-dicarboxylate transporter DctM subunit